ncbi:hypothetical protein [Singulisphaera sp. PoT]|uniref:hypothetical protein n=1 Tax=Singulisphaera sp. PoT TaxID=3411797 RepID=UPI003BF4D8E3
MPTTAESSKPGHLKYVVRGLAALVVALLGLTTWILLNSGMDLPPIPVPNGYDDLKRAGTMIIGSEPGPRGDVRQATEDELRAYLAANREALALGRAGLAKKCLVPLSAKEGTLEFQIADHVEWSGKIRRLSRLLACEARLAGFEGRRDDALRAELDLVRLGNDASRGGMVIDHGIGLAITTTGLALLREDLEKLSPDQCRRAIRGLETAFDAREPVAQVVSRESKLGSSAGTLQVRVLASFANTFQSQLTTAFDHAVFSDKRTAADYQQILSELGLRVYREEHGTLPVSLGALAPTILVRIPFDPFISKNHPLNYHPDSTSLMLYSVGPDGRDDGGKPMTGQTPDALGDLAFPLDRATRPTR